MEIIKIINGFLKIKIGRYEYSKWAEDIAIPINTSYRTGLTKLQPFFENVSLPIQHLVMTQPVSKEFLKKIEDLTRKKFPDNKIDWDSNNKMVDYVLDYKRLCSKEVSKIKEGRVGNFIRLLDPVRMAKITKIKIEVMKKLNDKYNPGMYSLPDVP